MVALVVCALHKQHSICVNKDGRVRGREQKGPEFTSVSHNHDHGLAAMSVFNGSRDEKGNQLTPRLCFGTEMLC